MSEFQTNPALQVSDAIADAVERAAMVTVLVNARRRMPLSGISYAPDLVLTADHGVHREENIQVVLTDGTEVAATLAGRDRGSDLALLRLSGGQQMQVARAAERDVRVGNLVLAVGRPSTDGAQASFGMVNGLGSSLRTERGAMIEQYILTDAVPYPGFSGGPLVDGDGRVLGINTSGFAPGASLAVPASTAWQVAQALSQYGRMRRGFLGIRSQAVELPPGAESALGRRQERGLLLVGVERGQPADQAGLMVGDILVGLDGNALEDHDNLVRRLAGNVAGSTVSAEILRGGRLTRFTVQVGEKE